MDESLINIAIELRNDIQAIDEFLLKGLVSDEVLFQLLSKSCELLGELHDTLEQLKEKASCK